MKPIESIRMSAELQQSLSIVLKEQLSSLKAKVSSDPSDIERNAWDIGDAILVWKVMAKAQVSDTLRVEVETIVRDLVAILHHREEWRSDH